MRVSVANTAPREPRDGSQRSAPEKMTEARAPEPPLSICAAGRIARDAHAVCAADRATPLVGRLLGRVTDRDPLNIGRAHRGLAKHPHGQLRKRTARVTQE